MSFLFEAFVISELIKAKVPAGEIKFWRTKNRQEVDIVLERAGLATPVEIKYKKRLKLSDFKGLRGFKAAYPGTEPSFMVNLAGNIPAAGAQCLSPFEVEKLIEGGDPQRSEVRGPIGSGFGPSAGRPEQCKVPSAVDRESH
jgi:hypothetical protein